MHSLAITTVFGALVIMALVTECLVPTHDDLESLAATGQGEKPKFAANSFLPRGSAPYVCSARHFATTEILVLVAMMVLRFDIMAAKGQLQRAKELELDDTRILTVHPRTKDVLVRVRPRERWQGRWNVKVGEYTSKFPLVPPKEVAQFTHGVPPLMHGVPPLMH